MNATKSALLVGLLLVGFQPACEMPNANTPGVRADGRGEGTPPPLARPTADPRRVEAAPPPPPPAPARVSAQSAPPRAELKDSQCLADLLAGTDKPHEQWVADSIDNYKLRERVSEMKREVETSLMRDWTVWIGNRDDLTDIRPSITRTKENAARIRCLQKERPGSDGEAIGHGINVSEERVEKWASRVEELLADESKCRASPECMAKRVIDGTGPEMCPIIADRNEALRQIAAERANPAGVVNLATLHDLGERVQIDNSNIAKLKAEYARAAKRPFNEGSCPR